VAATARDFQGELARWFQAAANRGQPYVDVRAGDLHLAIEQKHGPENRMPVCCGVMYSNIACRRGDEIRQLPAGDSGLGPELIIRYTLPRPRATVSRTGAISSVGQR
jgi:5-methylcytosine-specific restriction protein A